MGTLAWLVAAAALVFAVPAPSDPGRHPVAKAAAGDTALEKADVLVGPFVVRDRAKLLAAAQPVFDRLKAQEMIAHWTFIAPEPGRTCSFGPKAK
jgi:hypothetical protein